MSYTTEYKTIREIVGEAKDSVGALATFLWDGVNDEAASDSFDGLDDTKRYVRPFRLGISARRLGAGNDFQQRRRGFIGLQVIVPERTGDATNSVAAIVDLLVPHFRATNRSQVCFQIPELEDGRHSPDSGFFVAQLLCPFFRDEYVNANLVEAEPSLNVTQVGHGFTAPTAVYPTGSDVWAAASNDDEAKVAVGVVTGVSGDTFSVSFCGSSSFSHGLGSSGLIYTGASGAVATVPGTGLFSQPLGQIVSTSRIVVQIGPAVGT